MTKNQIQALRTAPAFRDGRTLKALAKRGLILNLRKGPEGWTYQLSRAGRKIRAWAYAAPSIINQIVE